MKKTLNVLILVPLMLLIPRTTLRAQSLTAKLKTDFANGKIEIEPNFDGVRRTDNALEFSRSSCYGICLGGFGPAFWERKKNGRPEDMYFFLAGDPDALQLIIVNYVCDKGDLEFVFRINHKFEVLEGEFELTGQMVTQDARAYVTGGLRDGDSSVGMVIATGSQVVANLDKIYPKEGEHIGPEGLVTQTTSYACSDEYRDKFRSHSLANLTQQFGDIFSVKAKGRKITITWDGENWVDRVERDALDIIQWSTEVLEQRP